MTTMQIGEVFGYPVTDLGERAQEIRRRKWCPFRNSRCTKVSKKYPVGICSLTDGTYLATMCPVRFLEGFNIFTEVARLAFGGGSKFVAAPEVRILWVQVNGKQRKIGKVDFIISQVDANGELTGDFAALEVQSVYFSGGELRTAFKQFIKTGKLDPKATRRPDWRSSIQKRLMPQLSIKVPRVRNLGKKFFVATDSLFFSNIPKMQTVRSFENSEVTWLIYPFFKVAQQFVMQEPTVTYTEWESVLTSLKEGEPLSSAEIIEDVRKKQKRYKLPVYEV